MTTTEMTKRDQYVEKMKRQLDEWNTELDRMEARGKELRGEAKESYETEVAALRKKLRPVRDKVTEIQSASEETWHRFTAEVEKLRDAFVHSFNYFRSQL